MDIVEARRSSWFGRLALIVGIILALQSIAWAGDAASTPVEPIEPPVATRRPTIYVRDLNHLARLVHEDPVVSPMAESVASRRTAALWAGWGLPAAGLALTILSFTALGTNDCTGGFCTKSVNTTAVLVGSGLLVLGPILGMALYPSRADVIDIINTWNERHVDHQFTIESQEVGRRY